MRASGPPPILLDFEDDDNNMLPMMSTNGYSENLLFGKLRELEEDNQFGGHLGHESNRDDAVYIFEGNNVLKSLMQY